ncbi:hypothetical protein Pint_30829 [Pistacia integerrima]|uniref:Uncharacterized protein n=1 Tax=Pistacia integerrima TaxID=434235 RepID=A0ACC0XPF3_9ROSI|nr:hypothetical protein Pint_30829 [Pistacia integerrima]
MEESNLKTRSLKASNSERVVECELTQCRVSHSSLLTSAMSSQLINSSLSVHSFFSSLFLHNPTQTTCFVRLGLYMVITRVEFNHLHQRY